MSNRGDAQSLKETNWKEIYRQTRKIRFNWTALIHNHRLPLIDPPTFKSSAEDRGQSRELQQSWTQIGMVLHRQSGRGDTEPTRWLWLRR